MLKFEKLIEPQYFRKFKCIASKCKDSCCSDWNISIDKSTFDAYQKNEDEHLNTLFDKHVKVNPKKDPTHIPYAQVILNDKQMCPFLTENKLCIIQKKLDDKALALICDSFPRSYNIVDGLLERSLCVSCPSAAELVLGDEKPIEFGIEETIEHLRDNSIPEYISGEGENKTPYSYFKELRKFIVSLLQDRAYSISERLVLVNVFCNRLEQTIAEHYYTDIEKFIERYKYSISIGEFSTFQNSVDSSVEIQLQAMQLLIGHRLNRSIISPKFLSQVDAYRRGIGDIEGASQKEVVSRYKEVYTVYYKPFMEKHEYILENYLVNYVFKNLFPFGPTKNNYMPPKKIYSEFCLLTAHYSMIKTLLIGLSGYYKEEFCKKHVITLIQTFSKAIEHNIPYLNEVVHFIEANNLDNLNGMSIFIKN